jgi:FtsP/CotA-like multicopper oxidase with cupredoxin domain
MKSTQFCRTIIPLSQLQQSGRNIMLRIRIMRLAEMCRRVFLSLPSLKVQEAFRKRMPNTLHTDFFKLKFAASVLADIEEVQKIMINNTAWYPYTNTSTLDVAMSQDWTGQHAYNFSADNVVLTVPNNSYAQLVVNSESNDPHPFHLVHPSKCR